MSISSITRLYHQHCHAIKGMTTYNIWSAYKGFRSFQNDIKNPIIWWRFVRVIQKRRAWRIQNFSWWEIEVKLSLDIHLDGLPLNFWPKWVINTTKLSTQIYTFWQNPRALRPKMALFWGTIEIEKVPFVLSAPFPHIGDLCTTILL